MEGKVWWDVKVVMNVKENAKGVCRDIQDWITVCENSYLKKRSSVV
jgi:hypothetical protein